jgi:hypothetical protein
VDYEALVERLDAVGTRGECPSCGQNTWKGLAIPNPRPSC